ncbi:MAG: sensor histidine kinase [Myxococcota bacterium]
MSLTELLSLCACMGHLAVAFLVLARGAKNAIAVPVALLCVNFFVWNFATWAYEVSGQDVWRWLDVTFSPLSVPLALHVTMRFVRSPMSLRPLLVLFYVLFGALSLSSAFAFISPEGRAWVLSNTWRLCFLLGIGAMMLVSLMLLTRHLRSNKNPDEHIRTRLFVAAVLLGGSLGSTELWDGLLGSPDLGGFGSMFFGAREFGALAATSLIAVVVLRFRLFGRDLSASVSLYAVFLALLATGGYLTVFQVLGTDRALLVVTFSSFTLIVIAATWDVLARVSTNKERGRELILLGRFSAQMAHDLKNPLAAMKGSLQFLVEEVAQGRSLDEHADFLALTVEQAERMERVINRYARLSRIEPVMQREDMDRIVRHVLSLLSLSRSGAEGALSVEANLHGALPPYAMDEDLIEGALDNVIQNALKAMPDGGILTVRTEVSAGLHEALIVTVTDTGSGMDARQLQRAFDDFYTTRQDGSGLGLAFVRRVVEAHGGEVRLSSTLGEGTTVTIELPYRDLEQGLA